MTRRFEYSDGKSNKFWEITTAQNNVTVRYGRIGTNGQVQNREHATSKAAQAAAEKQIAEKVAKGYTEQMSDTTHRTAWKIEPVENKQVYCTSHYRKKGKLKTLLTMTETTGYRWGYIIVSEDPRAIIASSKGSVKVSDFKEITHEYTDGVSQDREIEVVEVPDEIEEEDLLYEAVCDSLVEIEEMKLEDCDGDAECAGWRPVSSATEFLGALSVTEVSSAYPYDPIQKA